MQRLILSSEEIYPYLFDVDTIDCSKILARIGDVYDFRSVPPIPVYEIPEELRRRGWKYALPDGNHRWLNGHVVSKRVLCILLGSTEMIDIEGWGMAPFRNSNKADLFEKTLGIYQYQQGI